MHENTNGLDDKSTATREDNNNFVVQKNDGTFRQYTSAVVVNLLAFGYGSTVGWMSPVTEILKGNNSPVGVKVDEGELSWMSSLTFLGGIVGTLIWGRIADYLGRKIAGYSIGVSLIIGWCVILFTKWIWALYVGRFILGLSTGCFIVGPLYVAETVKDSLRGTLGSFVVLFMNIGVVYSYGLGAVLSYRMFTVACLVVPVVFMITYFFLPETPSYLWSKNRKKEAENSLYWLRSGNAAAVQMEIVKMQTTMKKQEMAGYSSLIETRANRKATVIGIGLFFFQQFCGILVILNYATDILTDSHSSVPAGLATTLVGLFQLISSTCCATVADRLGRKVLLVFSYGFMTIALCLLGLCFKLKFPDWVPFACLSLFVLTYPIGSGAVTYVVISEILAPKIRGLATSTFVLWGTANVFLTVKMYPWLKDGLGFDGCFWFFAAWCALALIFVVLLVPETKGIPLVDVLAKMNGEKVGTHSKKRNDSV